jgi:hypothetical protein
MPTRPLSHEQRLNAARRAVTNKAYDLQCRGIGSKLRRSQRWKGFRRWFIRRHPVCCDPFQVHKEHHETVITEQVHHIQGVEEHPSLCFVESNCAGLCTGCHSRVEGLVRSGKPTNHLIF